MLPQRYDRSRKRRTSGWKGNGRHALPETPPVIARVARSAMEFMKLSFRLNNFIRPFQALSFPRHVVDVGAAGASRFGDEKRASAILKAIANGGAQCQCQWLRAGPLL